MKLRFFFLALGTIAFGMPTAIAADKQSLEFAGFKPGAAPEAEAVAHAFAAALKNGDRDAVLSLLSAQAQISEGGHTQTRSEYAAAHLAADIDFLKMARIDPISFGSKIRGDSALVGSESEVHAISSKGQPVALRSSELLSLKRESGTWKIITVQWESAPLANSGK